MTTVIKFNKTYTQITFLDKNAITMERPSYPPHYLLVHTYELPAVNTAYLAISLIQLTEPLSNRSVAGGACLNNLIGMKDSTGMMITAI